MVTLAVVIGAHGVGGECRLKVFADDLAAYRSFNGGALNATSIRGGANGTIARFGEVPDRTAAEALRGTELRVPRSMLPPLADGEYYHFDLIGLPAKSRDGTVLGTVVDVENFGAGDVIEIERAPVDGRAGKRFMVPMRLDAVPHWDDEALTVDSAYVE
ncbi:Ribosome maturation factor RimM [Sphingomonas sp. EC-HK361]|uniref:ribosome maturation factor RimM n=1 Tax=Sphingomonas sp. EC-HK361 TaxID=2038397 RepID=UPI00125831F6|nr:ribosome maturation factor RimM [Sphingomonas sp. EC-HK361]VVT13023.1 Ribosome maturation factor RimM [Sphingomonas sp. EC-HK361]